MPRGSRAPISFLLVSATSEYAPSICSHRFEETIDHALLATAGHKVDDDLGVGGGLADRAVADEIAPKGQAVGEIAVMRDREAAAIEFGEERLDVAQDGAAGGRIAHVADGREAFQPFDHRAVGKAVADETQAAFEMKDMAVE